MAGRREEGTLREEKTIENKLVHMTRPGNRCDDYTYNPAQASMDQRKMEMKPTAGGQALSAGTRTDTAQMDGTFGLKPPPRDPLEVSADSNLHALLQHMINWSRQKHHTITAAFRAIAVCNEVITATDLQQFYAKKLNIKLSNEELYGLMVHLTKVSPSGQLGIHEFNAALMPSTQVGMPFEELPKAKTANPPTARPDSAKLIQPLVQLPHNLNPYSSAKGDHEYESGFPRPALDLTGIANESQAAESGKIIQPLGQLTHNTYPTSPRGDHFYECPSPRKPPEGKEHPAGQISAKTHVDGGNINIPKVLGNTRRAA
jgi:hypothetical protein